MRDDVSTAIIFFPFSSLPDLTIVPSTQRKKEKEMANPCDRTLKYYIRDFFALPEPYERGVMAVPPKGSGIPGCNIDASSFLRGNRGSWTTQFASGGVKDNQRQGQGQGCGIRGVSPLSNTASSDKALIAAGASSMLWPVDDYVPNACLPREPHFYRRSFAIFDGLPVRPNGCVDNVVQASNALRGGIDSRHTPPPNAC